MKVISDIDNCSEELDRVLATPAFRVATDFPTVIDTMKVPSDLFNTFNATTFSIFRMWKS